jgi:hypothetical protein
VGVGVGHAPVIVTEYATVTSGPSA